LNANVKRTLFDSKNVQGRTQYNIALPFADEMNVDSAHAKTAVLHTTQLIERLHQPPRTMFFLISCIYDPALAHVNPHVLKGTLLPPCPRTLQCPKTASSGRKLIVVSFGGS